MSVVDLSAGSTFAFAGNNTLSPSGTVYVTVEAAMASNVSIRLTSNILSTLDNVTILVPLPHAV